jgi:apolipoprotein N-acyltransferase
MQGKYPLDALTVRDAAHGETFVDSPTLTANDYTGEYLDSFLVSFHNAGVHAHAIANRKRFGIALLLFFLNRIDDLIHKLLASHAPAGAHSHSKARVLQPEIANQLSTSTKHQHEEDNIRKSMKICLICG